VKRRFRRAPDIAEVAGGDDLAQFGLARLRTKRRADCQGLGHDRCDTRAFAREDLVAVEVAAVG